MCTSCFGPIRGFPALSPVKPKRVKIIGQTNFNKVNAPHYVPVIERKGIFTRVLFPRIWLYSFMEWNKAHLIDHSRKYHNIPWCSLFVTSKFCISIVFSFSWEWKWPQEKLKTMLMQNFRVTNKEHYRMLWYFWSGQLSSKHLNCGVYHVSLNIKKPLAFKNVTDLKM